MEYILGVDIGTTNTKAVAYGIGGEVLTRHNRSYEFKAEEEGRHELDPDTLFNAVVDVIAASVRELSDNSIRAISFSAAMHGLIAVDAEGLPLTGMITWADLRSASEAAAIRNSEIGKKIYERTGTPIHPMSPLCKIIWMKKNMPEIFAKTRKFISIKEYVFHRFFGKYVIDYSVASATGIFDIHDAVWNKDALEAASLQAELLSSPVPCHHIIKGFVGNYASTLGLPADLPVVIGSSDGCLAHIGSNAIRHGDVSLTIGTSGAVRILSNRPVRDSQQRIFNYILEDGWYVAGGPVNNGGNVLQWFTSSILEDPLEDPDDFASAIGAAADVPAGADGLIFLPYIYGERAPVWDAEARGVFYGINGTHKQSHFFRAILEGIAFALHGILSTLEELGAEVNTIFVSGGFIKSEEWVQLVSDVLGKKLSISQAEDSSSAGAALLAMKALGMITDYEKADGFFGKVKTFEPNMKDHEACSENYRVYAKLYDHLKDIKK